MNNPLLQPTLMALVADAMSDPAWRYDPKTGRYRAPSGRFISRQAVLKIVDSRIEAMALEVDSLGLQLLEDALTLPDWEKQFAEKLKTISVQAFALGAGGVDRLAPADFLQVARQLKAEYRFLAAFAKDIALGEVTPGQFQARARMYVQKARAALWKGQQTTAQKAGMRFMRRILSATAEHCPECPAYAAAGIQPIGSLPLPTERCTCKSNCRCSVEFLQEAI